MGLEALLDRYCEEATEISVLLTSDERIQALNREYRGIDSATDVLSFPGPGTSGSIGDIAISVETAGRQAAARGANLGNELAMLAIHGGLHLAGYDDLTDNDRAKMIALMNEIAEQAGLEGDPDWHSREHAEDAS